MNIRSHKSLPQLLTIMTTIEESVPVNNTSISGSKISLLRSFDKELWSRLVQMHLQPEPSLEPVDNIHGSIMYRGVYYHSINPNLPYVRLIKKQYLTLPVVACCRRRSYEIFLRQFLEGDFNENAITVHVPCHDVLDR
jgi:hypothetical protein